MKFRRGKENKVLTPEEKIKEAKIIETFAFVILAISLTLGICAIAMIGNAYKVYNLMTTSTLYKAVQSRDKETDTLEHTYELMKEVSNIYETSYVGEIEREKIDEYVVNALVNAYGDKYSYYRNPEDTYATVNGKSSGVMGIGVYMRGEYEDNIDQFKLYMLDIYKDSPAEEAGMERGDYIVAIDNKRFSKTKYKYDDVLDDMRGLDGEELTLTYQDMSEGGKEKTVTLVRRQVATTSIRNELIENTGYILIYEFNMSTAKEIEIVINDWQSKGITNYIFDLRDNLGGVKGAAVDFLDYLLPEGELLHETDNNGNLIATNTSDINCIDFNSVCLVSENTASAAELVTQVLRDYNKTTVIGETTLGKGTVCTLVPLSDGSSIYVSTSKYITPSGTEIEGVGIEPDIELIMDDSIEKIRYRIPYEQDELIMKAIEILKEDK